MPFAQLVHKYRFIAVALSGFETERVAEASVEMFSRVGLPDEMLTNCGNQFMAEVMKEINRYLLRHTILFVMALLNFFT